MWQRYGADLFLTQDLRCMLIESLMIASMCLHEQLRDGMVPQYLRNYEEHIHEDSLDEIQDFLIE